MFQILTRKKTLTIRRKEGKRDNLKRPIKRCVMYKEKGGEYK